MAVALHLPDLPEVPMALGHAAAAAGAATRRRAAPWQVRLRDALATYLPLLLMALLALGSWWLVKNVPPPPKAREAAPPRAEPDYTMTAFTLDRFEAAGRLRLRLSGAQMRHFPDSDRIEVERPELEAYAPDGRVTRARADRGLSNGDGSEVQLFGAARVSQIDAQGEEVEVRSEFLEVHTVTEQMQTHLPVAVTRGRLSLASHGLSYDHGRGLLAAGGPARLVLPAAQAR